MAAEHDGNGGEPKGHALKYVAPSFTEKEVDALVLYKSEKTYVVPLDVIYSFEISREQNFDPNMGGSSPDMGGFSAGGLVTVTYEDPGKPYDTALVQMAALPCIKNIPNPPPPPPPSIRHKRG